MLHRFLITCTSSGLSFMSWNHCKSQVSVIHEHHMPAPEEPAITKD